MYLTMASAFEEFLRTTIQITVGQLASEKPKYEELDAVIRNLHLRESAKLLRRLDSPPEYLAITTEALCAAIGSCVPGSVSVKLCEEALGDVDGLIKLENFMERMSALGKQISFDLLAKTGDVSTSLKLHGSPTRTLSKALKATVESISKNRNRIAHMGGTASDVDLALLEEHRGVLRAVAKAIAAV
ncbi:MAG: HEPN domain-containing protein [Burkholderiales bacterium]|nr:HEPN domain-containing protein [Burkholderiales bacterium]